MDSFFCIWGQFTFSLNSYFHYTYSNELSLCFFWFKVFLLIFNVIMNILLCWSFYYINIGFPGGSMVKNPSANARDTGSIPGSGRSSGERNGKHSSILSWKNSMDRGGLVSYSPWGHKESAMTEQLNSKMFTTNISFISQVRVCHCILSFSHKDLGIIKKLTNISCSPSPHPCFTAEENELMSCPRLYSNC